MRKFELDYLPPSATTGEYPGAFPPEVDIIIRQLVKGKVLHLFSGSSLIGEERIDIDHPSATKNINVKEFILSDKSDWDWVVLDPPYLIMSADVKLTDYGISIAASSDVSLRRNLKQYFQKHTDNILWLDICAPMIEGFYRKKLWLVLTGGFHTVRILSWLTREMKPLL
ncbi:hypothetical protein LCGC14_1028730 [marine sediment metagenome]|uniref:DNA methylase N-4/N-6 domain-containing protein n=1 Tax=marine sediment metagenome TaxID=412755 RepID=A0A0F9MV84_9ZZZZ